MNKNLLTTFIIIGLVFFVLGGGLGVFYQIQKDIPLLEKSEAINVLSSKVIPSIVAYGRVTDISEKNITLTFSGDTLIIKIKDTASIYSFVPDEEGNSNRQKTNFSQIKKGDNVSVNLNMLPDGQLEGESVIILQSANASTQ